MKNILLFLSYYLLRYSFVAAQQNVQLSQYVFNQLYLNPSVAGVDETASEISILHRTQWLNYSSSFDNDGVAPTVQLASINLPFQIKENRLGAGLFFLNDNLGLQRNIEVKVSLAYHIKMKIGLLSFGLGGGLYNQKLDFNKLRFRDEDDPLNIGGVQNNNVWDFDGGLYFNSTYFFTGLGINHIFEPTADFGVDISQSKIKRHFNFIGGFNIDITRDVQITSSVLIKSDLNRYLFEGSVITNYNDKIYFGLSLREVESAIGLIGFYPLRKGRDPKRLKIGYAFDYVIDEQKAKASTSHEIMISYRIPIFFVGTHNIKPRTPRFRHE